MAAPAITKFATCFISERFCPIPSWDAYADGNIVAMLTCEGQLIVEDGLNL
jgi:hypothetical protein